MTDRHQKSLGERNYEQFADRYADRAETKPHNAYYERPATLSLMPDVAGKRVLDAGCGSGIYAEILLDRGAEVVAVDVTPAFVDITRRRLGSRATVLRADLAQPLDFAGDASFDVVIAPLVLDYIEDWDAVFAEFYRALKPGGVLVFSCGHPFADWSVAKGDSYFAIEAFDMIWKGFGKPYPHVKTYRRPLSAILDPLLNAGFRLDSLLEPQPTEAFRERDPEDYARLMGEPGFLCVRAIKG